MVATLAGELRLAIGVCVGTDRRPDDEMSHGQRRAAI
jgi:hypothetical protein